MSNAAIDVAEVLEQRLTAAFELAHLEVINESDNHNVPANSQTHFKVVLVSNEFAGVSRIARHRRINALVADLLSGSAGTGGNGVHALALHPYTLDDWQRRFGAAPLSPPCLGGDNRGESGSGNSQ